VWQIGYSHYCAGRLEVIQRLIIDIDYIAKIAILLGIQWNFRFTDVLF